MKTHHVSVLLVIAALSRAVPDRAWAADKADKAVQVAEANDGTWQSYCTSDKDGLRFIFLSKSSFKMRKGWDAVSGSFEFAKGDPVRTKYVAFSTPDKGKDVLDVTWQGNLTNTWDLSRSRVFHVDFTANFFDPIIRQIPVELQPVTSRESLTEAAAKVAAWLEKTDEVGQWEYTRVKVPDSGYHKGKPVATADPSIIWGEANDAGLRLGIGGLPQKAKIPAGQHLPVKQYIRNDGKETLRLSPTGCFNEGIEAELTNDAGTKISMNPGYKALMFFFRIRLEPGQFAELESAPLQTILANSDGSPSTGQRAYISGFVVSPGDYTLRLSHHVGQYAGKPVNASPGDPRTAPGLGEWRGTLKSTPISIRLTGPSVATAKPGTVVEIEKWHRIQFQKGQIVLSHRAGGHTGTDTWVVDADGNWPTLGGTWKTADSGGDYLAAWDEGGTRLWYVDATGIQRLDFAHRLADAGHWTMAEAAGDLANMPDGVRKALKLPAK